MFPFRDHNPSRRTPFITWTLIAINVIVFALYIPILNNEVALASFFDSWAMVPAEISNGREYYTTLTSMFLHGGFLHLLGNMLFLYIFGDNMEDAMGHIPFLLFYLASGLGADAIHILSDSDSVVPTVGASGAIAGVMGGYLLLYPKARVDIAIIMVIIFRMISVPAFVVLGFWMGAQLFGSIMTSSSTGGVAYWAHIGGFIIGLLFTIPIWVRLGGTLFWKSHNYHPPHPPTFERQL